MSENVFLWVIIGNSGNFICQMGAPQKKNFWRALFESLKLGFIFFRIFEFKAGQNILSEKISIM